MNEQATVFRSDGRPRADESDVNRHFDSAVAIRVPKRGFVEHVKLRTTQRQNGRGLSDLQSGEETANRFSRSVPSIPTRKSILLAQWLTPSTLVASDAFGLFVSGVVAVGLCRAMGLTWQGVNWLQAAALFPVFAFSYWCGGLYPGVGLHPVTELRQITKLHTTLFLAALAVIRLSGFVYTCGVFCSIFWIASLCIVPLLRTITRRLSATQSWWGFPTVVISSGSTAEETFRLLANHRQSGLRPCGIINLSEDAGMSIFPGERSLAADELSEARVDCSSVPGVYAVVALPHASRGRLMDVIETYRDRFPHLLIVSGNTGMPTLSRQDRSCGEGLAGTELGNKLLLPWQRLMKTVMDKSLAAGIAVFCLPVFACLLVLVKLTSTGPIFYGQRRLGRDGRHFTAWKFRTMRTDAAVLLAELLRTNPSARQEWEQDHKLRNDPRITRIGAFLRKTSLDELPQLWNVLIGDMSLVGPRPIVDDEVAKYGEVYKLYSQVTPGITGLWQISGRNNTTYPERVRLDDFYVRNWSPWMDLYVLARTVQTILCREGAY